jgi:myo-inositol-1(or 4)-monophosphatase
VSPRHDCILEELVAPVQVILRSAGQLILAAEEAGFGIEKKSDKNYVTEVDLAVQNQIVEQLAQLTPGYAIMAEEEDLDDPVRDRPVWILDPVDGTTNLMRHNQHSAISLALADGDELLLGFVYNPFLDELFTAIRGQGVTLNDRPVRASSVDHLKDSLISFGTNPYDRQAAHETFTRVERVFLHSLEVRRSGVAALDLAYIACGRYDGFFEQRLQPWDFVAGLLLVQEAGGQVCNWQGLPLDIHHPDSLLATNGKIRDALFDLVCDR